MLVSEQDLHSYIYDNEYSVFFVVNCSYLVALTLQQEQQGDTSSPAAETTDVGGGGVVGGTGGTGGGSGTHESDVPESVLAANEQEIQDATKDELVLEITGGGNENHEIYGMGSDGMGR